MSAESSLFQKQVGADVPENCFTGTAQTSKISFANHTMENAIIQDIQATVSVPVQTFFEIGSRNAHRVAARPQGQGTLSNVVGPCDCTVDILAELCDFCSPDDLVIEFSETCHKPSAKLTFTSCVCTGVTITANAANDVINGSWQLIFLDLERKQGSCDTKKKTK